MSDEIVIVGAGIIGLYTAYILSKQDKAAKVTVVAEYLPGDQSIKYTSPYAGGNFSCLSGADEKALRHDRLSFLALDAIFKQFGQAAGLQRLPTRECWSRVEDAPINKMESLKSYVPDIREIPESELPEGAAFGITYTTYNFYSPHFIQFLKGHLQKMGTTFIRRHLKNIEDGFLSSNTQVVFNCTGIGARSIGGVEDPKVYPIRGQVVVVRAPHVQENVSLFSDNYLTYIIPRPYSDGQVILGGFYQKNNWSGDTFGHETQSILQRTGAIFPHLNSQPVQIMREAAGLRPAREGGVRIEKQRLPNGKCIIHNYGAAGTGFQSGYGMSLEAVALMDDKPKL